jgi:hypothetical protein
VLSKTNDAGSWLSKYNKPGFRFNRMMDVADIQYAEIIVCGPLKDEVSSHTYRTSSGEYVPFDKPEVAGRGINTKLRIQLTLNYRLIIPFADWVIFRMWKGKEITRELHLDTGGRLSGISVDKYDTAAAQGVHIIPIRAQYAMKLHSDVPLDRFPASNMCL